MIFFAAGCVLGKAVARSARAPICFTWPAAP